MYFFNTVDDAVITVESEGIVTDPVQDEYLSVIKELHRTDFNMDTDDNDQKTHEDISEMSGDSSSQLKVNVVISNTSVDDHRSLFEKALAGPNKNFLMNTHSSPSHVKMEAASFIQNKSSIPDYVTAKVAPFEKSKPSQEVLQNSNLLVSNQSAAVSRDGSFFQIKYPSVDIFQNNKSFASSTSKELSQDNPLLVNRDTTNILHHLQVQYPSIELSHKDSTLKKNNAFEGISQSGIGFGVKSTPAQESFITSQVNFTFPEISQNTASQVINPFFEFSQDSTMMSINNPNLEVSQDNTTSSIINPSLENSHDTASSISNPAVEFSEFVRYFNGIGKTNENDNDDSQNNLLVEQTLSVKVKGGASESVASVPTISSGGISKQNSITIIKPPTYKDHKYGKVDLYAADSGPKIYFVKGNIITQPIITKNLPEAFRALPVHGKTDSKVGLENLYRQKIRDYVGYGISDQEFNKLEDFCSPEYLKTGNELAVTYSFPAQGSLPTELGTVAAEKGPGENLCIVKKLKLRMKKDKQNHYPRKLKYRGLRLLPLAQEDEDQPKDSPDIAADEGPDGPLEPGRDLIFRVRFYRPHSYGSMEPKPNRHSVFNNDIVLLGRQTLTVLRDRIGCPNDIGMRVDISDNPDTYSSESAKRLFPSGFLFINNVFYVDARAGCRDLSAGVRAWARRRHLGVFPVRDMADARLDRLVLRLGHPEVYMHQGKCEHLFTFSEVRLLSASDPLRLSQYPCHTAISQNQSVYCTTCAEFAAKWIVVGCARVPFDPAFFCETCFKLYLYDKDGQKIGNFKAYSFRGNTINFLKPVSGNPDSEMSQDGGAKEGESSK